MPDDILSEVLPEDRVPVVRPDGSLASVKQSNYEKALGHGYRFQTPEEQKQFHSQLKYGDRPIAAGAAGALRGATLGLSDVAGPALGIVDKETLSGLKEENPAASIAGDVAGTAASLLVPGLGELSGPALAARAGERAAESIGLHGATSFAAKALERGVAGGVEGGIFGAGEQVSESYLGDPDLTAEKIISHVGLGALLGGGGSIIGGAANDVVKKTGGSVEALLHTKAEDFAAKAIGGIQSSFRGMEKDEIRSIARDVIDSGVIGKTDRAVDILPKIKAVKAEAGKQIGDVLSTVDASGVSPSYSSLLSRIDAFESALNPAEADLVEGQLAKTRKFLTQMGSQPVGQSGFTALNQLKSTLQGSINYKTDPDAKLKLAKQVVGIVKDELDAQLKKVALPGEFEKFMKAKQLYGSFSEAEKWGKRGVKALLGNRTFSLTDYMAGEGLSHLATGNIPGILLGALGSTGNKVLRERGPSAAVNGLEWLAEHGNPSALGSHIAKTGAAAGAASGLIGGPAKHLSTLAEHLDEHDSEIDNHIDRVFRGERAPQMAAAHDTQDFGAKRMRREPGEAHQQRVDEIRQLQADPSALLDRVTANVGQLAEVAPNTAGAMARTAHTTVQYLAKHSEEPPKAGPLAPKWVHSQAEIHSFAQKLEAVQDPTSTLKHAAARTLTQEQVHAVATCYPSWYRATCDKMLEKAMTAKMPYQSQLMVSLFTGVDLDGSMASLYRTQSAINAAKMQAKPTEGEVGSKSPITLAQRMDPHEGRDGQA